MEPRVSLHHLPENIALKAETQKEFVQKVKEIKQQGIADGSGVIYVGHIPHGFFEPQMLAYFEQFGTVEKLRISRSKKTGNTKGYAFVQFRSLAVAKIVAETMNNYLMFHRLLKCQLLPMEKVHPNMFKGADRKFKKPKAHVFSRERHNKPKTEQKIAHNKSRIKKRKSKSLTKLADLGISFEYPGVVSVVGKTGESMEVETTEDSQTPTLSEQTALAVEALRALTDTSTVVAADRSIETTAGDSLVKKAQEAVRLAKVKDKSTISDVLGKKYVKRVGQVTKRPRKERFTKGKSMPKRGKKI